ncbi:MAG: hypothetical protein NT069_20735, partial [Planctomycetota bacterium]|nr:hypothetical protein [Planctomycetota bacterium]
MSVALDAISQLNVPRAESSIEELDRLLQANQTLSPWRKERQRRAVDELRFLSRRLTTHTANVTEFASQFALARRAAARKQMAVSKWHGSRALKALASFKSDTPEFYYDVARYYVGACSSLNVFEPDDFSFDEFDTFATEAWGHESGHAGVVKSWQLTLRMKMSNGDGVDLTEFVTALRMMQEVRDVHSDEYSIAAGLYALRLIQLRRFQQALEMCDEVLTDSVVVLANRSLDWGGSIVIYRIRAAALSGLGRHADAQKEFRISQRNSYGRIGMEHCLKAVIALESESFGDADKFRTMLNRDWKCRKEMSVSDGFADDATTAGNWVETGFVTTSELKRVGSRLKEVGNVQLALRSGDYSRATELLSAYVPASGDSAHSKLYPVCDHNWLSQDSPALRELNRAPATSNSRRAIQMAWAALDNDARAVALLSENLELGSTALKRDFGPKSASLWYFHRAAAKALRESGMFRQASEQLSQARSVLSAAGKIQSPFGIVQSTEEMVLAALLGDDSVDPKKYVLSREIKLPRTIAFLPLRAHEAMAMGMNCVVGKDFAGAEAFGSHADFLCRHEHLQEYNGPDFTTPLAQALRGAAYAHYGETESAEKEFASMKLALEGGEGIRAPELRWFALKLYADFLEKEGKTARAKKIRQLSEAELP